MGALYNAYWNKTTLIVLAGNQRRVMQNKKALLTNEDAVLVPRPFVKWSAEPAIASEVPAVLARAIHIAMSLRPDRCSSPSRWTTWPTSSAPTRSRTSK